MATVICHAFDKILLPEPLMNYLLLFFTIGTFAFALPLDYAAAWFAATFRVCLRYHAFILHVLTAV